MIPTLLILLYASMVFWWISKSTFFEIKGLSKAFISIVFLVKIMAGVAYGYIHQTYFGGGDTFLYFADSKLICDTFFSYPQYYINALLGYNPQLPVDAEVFTYPISKIFWRDLGTYTLVHVHAIFQLLSYGSYNVHIVFVAIISLIASLNFYRVFSRRLHIHNAVLVVACFFMPSVLFWTAGLHKDPWVYLGLSWVLVGLSAFDKNGLRIKGLLWLLLGLAIVGIFRHYLLLILFPTILAYCWALQPSKISFHPIYKYLAVFGVLSIACILMDIFGYYSPFELLSNRQQEFLSEEGGSKIKSIQAWDPSFWGMLQFSPQAIINVSFRPFLWEFKDFLQLLASLEIFVFWVLSILSFWHRKQQQAAHPLLYFLFFYAVCNLFLIGLLVGNIGTIVRYRAIPLGLLVVVLVQTFDWMRFGLRQEWIKSVKSSQKQNTASTNNEQVSILP